MFKVGELVKCTKSCHPHFTENKVYVIKEMHFINGAHIVEAENTDNGEIGIGYHMHFFVSMVGNAAPPKPPQCNCSGYDLFHKGHTCGLVKPRQWGLR